MSSHSVVNQPYQLITSSNNHPLMVTSVVVARIVVADDRPIFVASNSLESRVFNISNNHEVLIADNGLGHGYSFELSRMPISYYQKNELKELLDVFKN